MCCCLICVSAATAQNNLERGRDLFNWGSYREALPFLQSAAKEGYGEACYLLGKIYHYGWGISKDASIAHKMYQRGIEYGYNRGEAELGLLYEDGVGCAVDQNKALEFYKKSAEKGDVRGKYLLALCYYYGKGTDVDYTKSFPLFKDCVKEDGDKLPDNWAKWAKILLGESYQFGRGTAKNLYTAVSWYKRSDDGDYLYRAALLMDMYNIVTRGMDNGKDNYLWLALVKKNVKDNGLGYYLLSQWLPEGGPLGVGKGYEERFSYLLKAAERGYAPAQKMVGDCYKSGKGVPVNLLQSKAWYEKAEKQGYDIADAERIENDAVYRNSKGIFKRGDLWSDNEGISYIVTSTTVEGKPSRVMRCDEFSFETIEQYNAFVKDLRSSEWRIVNYIDISVVYNNLSVVNSNLTKIEKTRICTGCEYLYSVRDGRFETRAMNTGNLHNYRSPKNIKIRVARNIYF